MTRYGDICTAAQSITVLAAIAPHVPDEPFVNARIKSELANMAAAMGFLLTPITPVALRPLTLEDFSVTGHAVRVTG